MFSKLSISLVAALILSAGGARAVPEAEFSAGEALIPDSVDYAHRPLVTRMPKTEALDDFVVESGKPDTLEYPNRAIASKKISDADRAALEFGNPELR